MAHILGICPMQEYRMEIRFDNGTSFILDLTNKLHTIRFGPLSDKQLFASAVTDGTRIYWNDLIELSTAEIFHLIQSDDSAQNGAVKHDQKNQSMTG